MKKAKYSDSIPKIRKLDEAVVNRIAAGEVVQRPSAAIKELIENSLDAGATSIAVIVKDGGMKLLQIQDNGHGIRREDLAIVCERFTTSKISKFEDLMSVETFGFRGEALASITHVGHVTILTKTQDSQCAFKAKYLDGAMVPLSAGEEPQPKPCAGLNGTSIIIEDLFYNMPTRKFVFKNANEEYTRILDVVTKYAVRFGDEGVSFTCKKYGQSIPDLHTLPNTTTLESIKIAYGAHVAKELSSLSVDVMLDVGGDKDSASASHCDSGVQKPSAVRTNHSFRLKINGKVSNGNYSSKKGIFILFINNRLVECSAIKKVIELAYAQILPKHAHPFVFLSFTMPCENLDINVHPTKKEVHFLYEENILGCLSSNLSNVLISANSSRNFSLQKTLIPDVAQHHFSRDTDTTEQERELSALERDSTEKPVSEKGQFMKRRSVCIADSGRTVAPNKLVRTDAALQRIDSFFKPAERTFTDADDRQDVRVVCSDLGSKSTGNENSFCVFEEASVEKKQISVPFSWIRAKCACCNGSSECSVGPETLDLPPSPLLKRNETGNTVVNSFKFKTFPDSLCSYSSVQLLMNQIRQQDSLEARTILKNSVFVGVVDETFTAAQSGTTLYLFNHFLLSRLLFYQLAIRRFQELPVLKLEVPVDIRTIVSTFLEVSHDATHVELSASEVTIILRGHSGLLRDYFSIDINENGQIVSLPLLLEGYRPVLAELPRFLVSLAMKIDWTEEVNCFRSISEQIAVYYATLPLSSLSHHSTETQCSSSLPLRCREAHEIVSRVFFPAIKSYLIASEECFVDGSFIEISKLERLYTIFERC